MRKIPISTILKNSLKRVFRLAGLEVRKTNPLQQAPKVQNVLTTSKPQRNSLEGVLQQAKNRGFSPATVIDVGAAYGMFTSACQPIFPEAKYMLIEPLEEYTSFLETVVTSIPGAEYIPAALTAESGEITINIHPDLVGSSLYLEEENSDVNGVPRKVHALSLDAVLEDRSVETPILLKIDVQGAELDVLSGAKHALKQVEFMILEVVFFEFFKGGPQFHNIVQFMDANDFVVYDIFDLQYRPLDNALAQADMVFVKKNSNLRKHHFYATREQRALQTKELQAPMKK